MSHLNQLHEVFKVHLVINCELAVVVDDTIVLHLAIAAHTQGVVTGEVGALSHQVQAGFRGVKQLLCLVPRYLPMKPPESGRTRELSVWIQWMTTMKPTVFVQTFFEEVLIQFCNNVGCLIMLNYTEKCARCILINEAGLNFKNTTLFNAAQLNSTFLFVLSTLFFYPAENWR